MAIYLAIALVSIGFWAQVWRIHVHKEVRDLSLIQYISLAIGYIILGFEAYDINSWTFLLKQIVTVIPVIIIIGQIWIHKEDKWKE